MPIWDGFLSDRDRAVFARAGFGSRLGFGDRPVVLVVDVSYSFVGHERSPILEAVETWPNSCGEEAWDALEAISELLATARKTGIPVIYTHGLPIRSDGFGLGPWRNTRISAGEPVAGYPPQRIVAEIAPRSVDVVIAKARPSAFFGTPLISYLHQLGADTLLVVGTTTSGCVRATVVDAFSYNLRVAVVEEGTFDRGEASHAVSLFDMDQKYADVVSLALAKEYLDGLPSDLYDGVIDT